MAFENLISAPNWISLLAEKEKLNRDTNNSFAENDINRQTIESNDLKIKNAKLDLDTKEKAKATSDEWESFLRNAETIRGQENKSRFADARAQQGDADQAPAQNTAPQQPQQMQAPVNPQTQQPTPQQIEQLAQQPAPVQPGPQAIEQQAQQPVIPQAPGQGPQFQVPQQNQQQPQQLQQNAGAAQSAAPIPQAQPVRYSSLAEKLDNTPFNKKGPNFMWKGAVEADEATIKKLYESGANPRLVQRYAEGLQDQRQEIMSKVLKFDTEMQDLKNKGITGKAAQEAAQEKHIEYVANDAATVIRMLENGDVSGARTYARNSPFLPNGFNENDPDQLAQYKTLAKFVSPKEKAARAEEAAGRREDRADEQLKINQQKADNQAQAQQATADRQISMMGATEQRIALDRQKTDMKQAEEDRKSKYAAEDAEGNAPDAQGRQENFMRQPKSRQPYLRPEVLKTYKETDKIAKEADQLVSPTIDINGKQQPNMLAQALEASKKASSSGIGNKLDDVFTFIGIKPDSTKAREVLNQYTSQALTFIANSSPYAKGNPSNRDMERQEAVLQDKNSTPEMKWQAIQRTVRIAEIARQERADTFKSTGMITRGLMRSNNVTWDKDVIPKNDQLKLKNEFSPEAEKEFDELYGVGSAKAVLR